ncbi:MAG: hypothetical protein ACTTH0_04220, partial [Eubacteriales bacterium]
MKKNAVKRILSLLTVLAVFFAMMPASYAADPRPVDIELTLPAKQVVKMKSPKKLGDDTKVFKIKFAGILDNAQVDDRNVVITGLPSGMGYEVAKDDSDTEGKTVIVTLKNDATNPVLKDYKLDLTVKGDITSSPDNDTNVEIKKFLKVKAYEFTDAEAPKATIGNVDVKAIVGVNNVGTQVTVTLANDWFNSNELLANIPINDWFTNIPEGLVARIENDVPAYGDTIDIFVAGTAKETSNEKIELNIPGKYLVRSKENLKTQKNDAAQFIVKEKVGEIKTEIINGEVALANKKDITVGEDYFLIKLTNATVKD